MSEPNGYEYRFRKIEDAIASLTKRIENIDEHGSRRVGVVDSELRNLREDIAELNAAIKELRQDVRDTRHRLTAAEAAISNVTRVCSENTEKVGGLQKSIIGSALGLIAVVIGSIVTMWLALGGPP